MLYILLHIDISTKINNLTFIKIPLIFSLLQSAKHKLNLFWFQNWMKNTICLNKLINNKLLIMYNYLK